MGYTLRDYQNAVAIAFGEGFNPDKLNAQQLAQKLDEYAGECERHRADLRIWGHPINDDQVIQNDLKKTLAIRYEGLLRRL